MKSSFSVAIYVYLFFGHSFASTFRAPRFAPTVSRFIQRWSFVAPAFTSALAFSFCSISSFGFVLLTYVLADNHNLFFAAWLRKISHSALIFFPTNRRRRFVTPTIIIGFNCFSSKLLHVVIFLLTNHSDAVSSHARTHRLWKTGRYKNYSPDTLIDLLAQILALVRVLHMAS
jgi:hypothetical protein